MHYYLITGGAGFIGSHVAEALLNRGDRVICIDNFNKYYTPRFKRENVAPLMAHKNFVSIEADITDWNALRSIFGEYGKNIDAIIHLAASAGVRYSIENPRLYAQSNYIGTTNLLELAKEYHIGKFIFASSSSVYGNNEKIPFSEDDPVDAPISPYAASKRAGELLVYTYHHLYNIDTVCLRFFTVYGPKGRPDMAPYLFTERIAHGDELIRYGDGTTRRDYTFITDILQGLLATLDHTFGYEIINLGNSHTVTLNEFIGVIENHLGKKARIRELPIPPGDVIKTNADITKAHRLLDFTPKTSFAEGMGIFVQWYMKNRL